MDRDELRNRTKRFALGIVKLVGALPNDRTGDVLGRQLLKSGTSVGANYREALRASSRKHFLSIVQVSLREADETLYWLEILAESKIIKPSRFSALTEECDELVAILTATVKSTKQRMRRNSAALAK